MKYNAMILTDFELRTMISWSRFRESIITPGECIQIHQWIGQRIELPPELKLKLQDVHASVPTNWQPPETKYNDERVLLYEDPETLTFKPVRR